MTYFERTQLDELIGQLRKRLNKNGHEITNPEYREVSRYSCCGWTGIKIGNPCPNKNCGSRRNLQ